MYIVKQHLSKCWLLKNPTNLSAFIALHFGFLFQLKSKNGTIGPLPIALSKPWNLMGCA